MAWTLSAMAWTASGKRIGALSTSFIRLLVASVMLAAYGKIARGHWLPTDADQHTWLYLGLSGFFGFFVSDLLMFRSLLLVGPRIALLIQSLGPPLTAVMAWFRLGEAIDPLGCLGILTTVSGVSWVVLGRTPAGTTHAHGKTFRNGLLLAIAATVAQAIGFVFSKEGIGDYDPMAGTFIRVLVAIGAFSVLLTGAQQWPRIGQSLRNRQAMGIIAYGSLVGPVLGVALSLIAIRNCPTGLAATLIATSPVLILPFAVLVYREKLTIHAICGALLSVVGVVLLAL